MADPPRRPTWSCGHPVSPNVTFEEAQMHVGHAVQQQRAGILWVSPIVTGAEVDPTEFCTSCGALMVRLTIGGLGDDGVVELPSILLCPDCYVPTQVVDQWRAKVQGDA